MPLSYKFQKSDPMNTTFTNTPALLEAIKAAGADLRDQLSGLGADRINTVPFEGSWTAAQLADHVSKATAGLAATMAMEGEPTDRQPDERVDALKTTFLDFSLKMQSPDFIKPGPGPYQKEEILAALDNAFGTVGAVDANADMSVVLNGLPMGPITKLELLHFVLYHTLRHNHQLENIRLALQPE